MLGGTANVACFYNNEDGVIVGADTRITNKTYKYKVSDRVRKIRVFDHNIVATMSGNMIVIGEVWDVIEHEVKENDKKNVKTTADMALQCVSDFIKSTILTKRFSLFIIGMQNEKLKIWLIRYKPKEDEAEPNGKEELEAQEIKTWEMIGSGIRTAKTEMRNHNVSISEQEGRIMATKALLVAALNNPGIGGYIVIRKIDSTGTKIIECNNVPEVLLRYYDDFNTRDKSILFLLSLQDVDDDAVIEWFKNGSTISAVKTLNVHTIGKVRQEYNLRRVIFPQSSAAALCTEISAVCQNSGFFSDCTDPIISKLPFIHVFSGLFYFAPASKELLEKLCRKNNDA